MKRGILGFAVSVVSLAVTFILFHFMSWYNFGDMPTPIVVIRIIIFWAMLTIIMFELLLLLPKFRR